MLTIPFDPALVLGNVVDEPLLHAVLAVSAAGAPADSAQEALNALILAKRSLDMTIQELTGMGINPEPVIVASAEMGKDITEAAVAYAVATIESQKDIVKAKGNRAAVPVSESIESPLDYNRSALKGLPLSADTFKMDAQFFTNDENSETASTTAATVSAYVAASVSFMGEGFSSSATASAQSQMHQQYQRHSIAGTLVITAGATHKQAQVWAPLIIDPDKAVRVWNALYPDDRLKPTDPGSMAQVFMQAYTKKDDKGMKIMSGATYGSSFVGMVHLLNVSKTSSSETMFSVAQSCQAAMTVSMWFQAYAGAGESSSLSNDVKNLLSSQQIQSHCSLVTTGIIPSIKSNDAYKTSVAVLNNGDDGTRLAALQNATVGGDGDGGQATVSSMAGAAMTGQKMQQLNSAKITAVLGSLGQADSQANKVIDTASMMTAFEDYVTRCVSAGDNFGVPINYYLKSITKSQIAQLWVAKYYPQFIAIGENDQVAAQEKKT